MKKVVIRILSILVFTLILTSSSAQNVGINCLTPSGKLHIRGSADIPQFVLDAHSTQSNANPLIKLRNVDGVDLLWINADDTTNTFLGLKSGRVNNVAGGGINNTFIGKNSGYTNTTGWSNAAVGKRALYLNTTGYNNCAFGADALYANSNGAYNLAIGRAALYSNTGGFRNIAIGFETLENNLEGSDNLGLGYGTLNHNTGDENIGIGVQSLSNSTIGEKNTALGIKTMISNKAGSNATAVGYQAMFNCNSNTNAFISYDVAVGYEALYGGFPTITGSHNTALGYQTLWSNTSGSYNSATGSFALQDNSTGTKNTANGADALRNNTTGANNTAIGYQSLYSNSSGGNNSAVGYLALKENTGSNNSANGHNALLNNTIGNGNTGMGVSAIITNTTGSQNTGLGNLAYFGTSGLSNTMCLGYLSGGIVNASNRIEIGNTSVSWIGGEVTWGTYSDERIKDNVEANVPGLEFINRLRPVTYNLNIHRQNEMVYSGKKEETNWPEKYELEQMRITGFLAQEVAQAAIETGYEFSGVDIPRDPNDLYSIRYSDFVMPLVKATQELSASNNAQDVIINELRDEVAYQKSENAKLVEKLEKLESMVLTMAKKE